MTMLRPADGAPTRSAVRGAKAKRAGLVVVCAKCAKRQGLRPRDVRRLLKVAAERVAQTLPRDGRRRWKLRVAETGCLGPCPKRAVAIATGASLAAGRALLLDPEAGPDGALAALLSEFGPNAGLGRAGEPSQPA